MLFFLPLWLSEIAGLLVRLDLGGAGLTLLDIIVPALVLVWFGKKIARRERFHFPRWQTSGWFFLLWVLVSFLIGAAQLDLKATLVSGAYLFRLIFFLLLGWAAWEQFSAEKQAQQNFWRNLFTTTGIIVILGYLQFLLVPDISSYSTEGGWDPHIGRLLGTWLDPNYLAGFLGFLLPLIASHIYTNNFRAVPTEAQPKKLKQRRWGKFWLIFLFILSLGALFLTFSRSGYLAAMLGLGWFFLWKDPKIILLGIVIGSIGIISNQRAQERIQELTGTVAAVIFQQTDEVDPTATLRIQNWGKSFQLFKKHPITGIGYNTYRYIAAEEGIVDENYFSAGAADSTHLTVLVTTGIVGFFLYLSWLFKLWWKNFRGFLLTKFTKDREKNTTKLGLSAALIALIVHASFVNSLFFPLIFVPVMLVLAKVEAE